MVVIDTVARLLPEVLGDDAEFDGRIVQSRFAGISAVDAASGISRDESSRRVGFRGNHAEIAKWRVEQKKRTQQQRPDLI